MMKLKLPMIRAELSRPKILSMDEYLGFVKFHLKETFNKAAYLKWKKMLSVNVRFEIRS